MPRHALLLASYLALLGAGCPEKTAPRTAQGEPAVSTAGKSDGARPPPLETAPPNVPEFSPAYPEQTRAPLSRSTTPIRAEVVARGLEKPWALAFLPDGSMLVTEKAKGRLRVLSARGEKSPPVEGVPEVDGRDQGGLLDVALAPDFATSQRIFLSYYEPRSGGNGLAVVRGKLSLGGAPRLLEPKVVFRMEPTLDSTKHAGGRLVFGRDGLLFVTLGERSILEGRKQAQDLTSHLGKIVRITEDGAAPPDNPFVTETGARPEIWTRGHRNVLAADLDAEGRLWVVEMGPRGGDELNLIAKGRDYGWPTIGYGEEYSGAKIHERTAAPGLEQPVYYWDPVISPSSLTIYRGTLFPEWRGHFFVGGLSSKALVRLVLDGDKVVGEERLLTDLGARIREVVEGPDGALYLLTDADDGVLYRVAPAGP
jgi:aldose sugar dehydrogenase